MGVRWQDRLEELVSEAADAWASRANRLAMGGQYPPFYLYHRESTEREWGALYMVAEELEEADPEWVLSDPQPFHANLTRDLVRRRVRDIASRLPLIPSGKV